MSDPNIWWMKCDECLSTGKQLLREVIKLTPTKNDLAIKSAVELTERQFRSKNGIKINLRKAKVNQGSSA
jgi:hypothetical protein